MTGEIIDMAFSNGRNGPGLGLNIFGKPQKNMHLVLFFP
jgi:hypothetical protein